MDVSTSRVVAIFGHKNCLYWILQVKMDVSTSCVVAILRMYLSSITSLCFHWILPVKMDVSTSRVVAIFGHKSCFHVFLPVKKDVSTSRVVATLRVYLRPSGTSLCFD